MERSYEKTRSFQRPASSANDELNAPKRIVSDFEFSPQPETVPYLRCVIRSQCQCRRNLASFTEAEPWASDASSAASSELAAAAPVAREEEIQALKRRIEQIGGQSNIHKRLVSYSVSLAGLSDGWLVGWMDGYLSSIIVTSARSVCRWAGARAFLALRRLSSAEERRDQWQNERTSIDHLGTLNYVSTGSFSPPTVSSSRSKQISPISSQKFLDRY